MFLKRPDLAFKYPKRMYEEFGGRIFDDSNKEIVYYASALALYRFDLLASNNTIPANARRLKWHMLPLVAAIVSGKQIPQLNSREMQTYAKNIIDKFSEHNSEGTAVFAHKPYRLQLTLDRLLTTGSSGRQCLMRCLRKSSNIKLQRLRTLVDLYDEQWLSPASDLAVSKDANSCSVPANVMSMIEVLQQPQAFSQH
jgi:hypothetical protein